MNIQVMLDEALRNKQAQRKSEDRSGKISPSKLGRCYRMSFWYRSKEEETNKPDDRTLRVFAVGNLFHEFVQQFLPEHQVEVKVETDDILGYADIVCEEEIIDLKSQHSGSFWYMEKANFDINKEKHDAILQTMIYAKLLNKPKTRLVFISKDDFCIAEYPFIYKEWEEELEKELGMLRSIWDRQALPQASPRCYGGTECLYCNFFNKCYKLEGTKHPMEQMLVYLKTLKSSSPRAKEKKIKAKIEEATNGDKQDTSAEPKPIS